MVKQAVGSMSGGEKARLVLAMMVWQRPNLLLLDEPTNHLDLVTREALAMALNEFEGTLMLVSHDRALLRSVCDEFWLVGRGGIAPFDGDLDDYQKYLLDEAKRLREEVRLNERANTAAAAAAPVAPAAIAIKTEATPPGKTSAEDQNDLKNSPPTGAPAVGGAQQRKQGAQARQALLEKTRPLKKELEQVDKRMAQLTTEKAALEHDLTQPMPPADIAQNGKRLKATTDEIATLEERWLELSSALEALTG